LGFPPGGPVFWFFCSSVPSYHRSTVGPALDPSWAWLPIPFYLSFLLSESLFQHIHDEMPGGMGSIRASKSYRIDFVFPGILNPTDSSSCPWSRPCSSQSAPPSFFSSNLPPPPSAGIRQISHSAGGLVVFFTTSLISSPSPSAPFSRTDS